MDVDAQATWTSAPSSASGSSSEGAARFAAGTVLGERYRIVGLLGRGGMGEVYRADDLKLGRTVALKFLSASMERDPGRLARFLNEVRTAVRVTHPSVCRVHDVGEVDGSHYLSMEYVDGEDLSTLLRRIGRLPGDRAVRAARQLCAGLAAAHSQGVLHRDLKPGNVMIDGRGEVKITDFGLAGAIGDFDGAEIRAGTPAYMAPEQIQGREVTIQSDLYALGLVLYEMFSGTPAYEDPTPRGIARRSETPTPSLTSAIDGVDPAVARIVERCLETDPADRPGSAMAVAAALPGGDPLAAALAAGETPSPELIAEAGASGGLRTGTAVALLASIGLGILATGWLSTRNLVSSRIGLDRSPAVLVDRAEDIVRTTGWDEGLVDHLHEWVPNWSYYQDLRTRDTAIERWNLLQRTRPAGFEFVYRASPAPLKRFSEGSVGNWLNDPPPTRPGMVSVQLDPGGRLLAFRGVPEFADLHDAEWGEPGATANFAPLFEAAGLTSDAFQEVEPSLRPGSFADRRYAWLGRDPDLDGPEGELRIEASSIRGRPLTFVILEPWDVPRERPSFGQGFWERASDVVGSATFVIFVIGAVILAVRNSRLGRGDHRTALRFGLYLAGVRLVWMLDSNFEGATFVDTFVAHLAWSAYRLFLCYVFYMALEPYARRLWPEMLVSWVRLFGGRFRDARVGRDLILGVTLGCAIAILRESAQWISLIAQPSNDGLNATFWSWEALRGLRSTVVAVAGVHVTSAIEILQFIMIFLMARILTRSTWVAVATCTVLALVLENPGTLLNWSYVIPFVLIVGLFWWGLFRAGLLTVIVAFSVQDLLRSVRVTWDLSAWHALPMWFTLLTVLAVSLWGFRATLVGRPLFREEIRAGQGV